MWQQVWKPAVLTWVKKPAPSSTAMLTWLPLFLSPLTVKTSETWAQSHVPSCPPAGQSYTLSLTQSANSVLILTSRANIPLRGKSKVPSAQVTEWDGGAEGAVKKRKNAPTNLSTGGNGYKGSFRWLVDTVHTGWRDGGKEDRGEVGGGKREKRKGLSDSRRVSKQSAEHHLAECHAARQIPSAASQCPSSPLWLSLPL